MRLWKIVVTKVAQKRLDSIPNPYRQRISDAIDMLTQGPYGAGLDVKQLHGRNDWRLRVGSWRVLFQVDGGKITITVLTVGPRGDVYKK